MTTPATHRDYYLPYAWHAWGGSLALHLLILILAILQIQFLRQPAGISGDPTPVNEVGIYIKNPNRGDDQENSQSQSTEISDPVKNPSPNATDQQKMSESKTPSTSELPVELQLPETNSIPAIGIGAGGQQASPSQQMQNIATLPQSGRPTTAVAIPAGTVEFFNVKATGRSFLFVVDMSDSMFEYSAFKVAKREILANLEQLKSDQQFQIIFYNENCLEMSNNRGKSELNFANPVNLNLARSFIQERQPNGGTEHYPAIIKAINYGAEVIFFLTDAAEPELSARQLDSIRRLNNGRATIHCIQFSKGAELNIDNFLKKLAGQNNGTYRYRDVTRFATIKE